MIEKLKIKRDKTIKRLKIEVVEGGSLLVSAPIFINDSECINFVNQNAKKLSRMIQKQLSFESARAELDGHFLYLGKKTKLDIDASMRKRYSFDGSILMLSKQEHFRSFLGDEARRIITPKLEDIATFYGVTHSGVSFRDTKSRWGSCTSKKTLNFSTRLVGAPKSVIEYVIIHEVCHLKELNHSATFWAHVSHLAGDYKQSEKWLKDNGKLLFLY